MMLPLTHLDRVVQEDPGIAIGYQHAAKRATPREPLALPGMMLKWYELHSDGQPVPDQVTQLARNWLMTAPLEARGLGFVILHRCGEGFYFLILCTWNNSNELWETVFYKDGDTMADFAPFPREAAHKPTLCVWELVPVWHEQQAWVRFLTSARDQAAAQVWLQDCFAGPA